MSFSAYAQEQTSVINAVQVLPLDLFLNGLREVRERGSILWVAGNGGSSSTASHAVADLNKTALVLGRRHLPSVAVSDMTALTSAFSNDVGFTESISGPLSLLAKRRDGLLLISVSGTSRNIISAIEYAKANEITTFCLFGEKGELTSHEVNFPIVIPSSDYQIVENIQLMIVHWLAKNL